MSAQFKKGDRVEYVGHPTSGYVSQYLLGKTGTVADRENLSPDSVPVIWDHDLTRVDGVLRLNVRHLPAAEPEDTDDAYVEPLTEPSVDNSDDLTEPEPLKAGAWCLVWSRVTGNPREFGQQVSIARPDGYAEHPLYARPDAIVRPSAGDLPPWLEAEQAEAKAISAIKTALVVDGGMHDDRYTQQTAESLYRAGIRATKGGAS